MAIKYRSVPRSRIASKFFFFALFGGVFILSGLAYFSRLRSAREDEAIARSQATTVHPKLLAAAPQQGGVTYYVAPTGSDGNTGVAGKPFKTIQKAANVVEPGDTVIVEDGTYTYGGPGYCYGKVVVCLPRGGRPDNWVVFKARNQWAAKLDGRNGEASVGFGFAANAGYVRLEGFDISGLALDGSAAGIEIFNGGHDVQIVNNHIHHIGKLCTDTSNGNVGIFIQQGHVTVDGNLIHDIGRFAPGEQGCQPSGPYYQNHDHGIYVNGNAPGAQDALISNNIFYNVNRGWSVQLYPGTLQGVAIVNNTFATKNPYRDGHIIIYSLKLSDSIIQNNIFYDPGKTAITLGGSGIRFSNVLLTNNITTSALLTDLTAAGLLLASNKVATDPRFVNASKYDYSLQRESPALDAGIELPGVLHDFEGKRRPQGPKIDIGALEVSYGEHRATPPRKISPSTNLPGNGK